MYKRSRIFAKLANQTSLLNLLFFTNNIQKLFDMLYIRYVASFYRNLFLLWPEMSPVHGFAYDEII